MLKKEIVKVFGIVTASIVAAIAVAGVLIYTVHIGPNIERNVLQILPASQVMLVSTTGTSSSVANLPADITTAWEQVPTNAEYFFVVEQNGVRIFGYSIPKETEPTIIESWSTQVREPYTLVSSEPLVIPNEGINEPTIHEALPHTKPDQQWSYISSTLREEIELLPYFTTNTGLLMNNDVITAINTTEPIENPTVSEMSLLTDSTDIGFSQHAFKYLAEPHQTLLVSRIEYLWSTIIGSTDFAFDMFLEQTGSSAAYIELDTAGTIVISGMSTEQEAIKQGLEYIHTQANGTTVVWEEITRQLDNFTHSTIVASDSTVVETTEPQIINGWTVVQKADLTTAYKGKHWFITTMPTTQITKLIEAGIAPKIHEHTIAMGRLHSTSQSLLPIEFVPENITGQWKLVSDGANLKLELVE